jgi:NAD(P)-dependent dehydrogenase (short-subunit alcohol dehydrogenase family)
LGSSARTPVRGYGVWGTLHGSINALVRQAAIDLAPIRVNAVSPGGIGIRADRQLTEHRGQFEDVANMILAVVANPAVTAAVIDVDGGERLGTWNG